MQKPVVKHDLEISHGSIYGREEEQALLEVLRAGAPSCGKKVKQFEDAFAAYCGTRYALAVTSATTGLTLAGIAAVVVIRVLPSTQRRSRASGNPVSCVERRWVPACAGTTAPVARCFMPRSTA